MPNRTLLFAAFLLNGMGVVLLGPLLPHLAHLWWLTDSQKGMLLAAQFLGSSLGTFLVSHNRRMGLLVGSLCSWLGLSTVAALLTNTPGARPVVLLASAALALYGFGLGQVSSTLNLAVGQPATGRAARLSFGNALWSVGAICSPIVAAFFLAAFSPSRFLFGFAAAFLLAALASLTLTAQPSQSISRIFPMPGQPSSLSSHLLFAFALLFLLYGGAETCLSGWLTTFTLRSAASGDTSSTLTTSAFWIGIASGRALAAPLLGRFSQRSAMRFLLAAASVCAISLFFCSNLISIAIAAAACGAFLGPVFASALTAFFCVHPTSRQTGLVLAFCGIGAAAMPFLLGFISQQTSSLRTALLLPAFCLLVMLTLISAPPLALIDTPLAVADPSGV
jgi:FHS family glucose/mannose:H+ symporter-like MFS transporter